jgi:hypothetical protein
MCAVFLKEGYILFLKGWCPMMFELVLDVTDRFLNPRDTNAECAIRPWAHSGGRIIPGFTLG